MRPYALTITAGLLLAFAVQAPSQNPSRNTVIAGPAAAHATQATQHGSAGAQAELAERVTSVGTMPADAFITGSAVTTSGEIPANTIPTGISATGDAEGFISISSATGRTQTFTFEDNVIWSGGGSDPAPAFRAWPADAVLTSTGCTWDGTTCAPTSTWTLGDGTVLECRDTSGSGSCIVGRLPVARKLKPVTLAQVKASAKPVPAKMLPAAAYITLANLVKLDSAATDEARLLSILSKLKIDTYDFDTVDNWLSLQAQKETQRSRWVWKPLRDADMVAFQYGTFPHRSMNQYGKRVPAEALAKAANILKEFPDAAFGVSDYEVIKPDPFLMVTTVKLAKEGKFWIIAQWDEPGFGQVPTSIKPELDPAAPRTELIAEVR